MFQSDTIMYKSLSTIIAMCGIPFMVQILMNDIRESNDLFVYCSLPFTLFSAPTRDIRKPAVWNMNNIFSIFCLQATCKGA